MKMSLSVAEAKGAIGNVDVLPKQERISIFATVDGYLAVFRTSDGSVKAETNISNQYFADKEICVVYY